jgi:chromodomain-helicase-DNA-binding protein 4
MGRHKKTARPIPSDKAERIEKVRVDAKRKAFNLLSHCLNVNGQELQEAQSLKEKVQKLLNFQIEKEVALKDDAKSGEDLNNNSLETSSKTKSKSSKHNDIHNEECEVCDQVGDLLCCDTCTLVFHLKCLRPKLATVPKGNWSCAHCIIEVSK